MSPPRNIKAFTAYWNLPAAFAGWLLPGLGHFLMGQRSRGVILATSIGTLWLGGLLIGGISVIDHKDHFAWLLGQIFLAPSHAADRYHYQLIEQQDAQAMGFTPGPDDDPLFEPAYGRAHEQGNLLTSLAGLLNLLAMIDVIYREPQDKSQPKPQQPPPPS